MKVNASVIIDKELLNEVDRMAREQERTRSMMIVLMIKKYLGVDKKAIKLQVKEK